MQKILVGGIAALAIAAGSAAGAGTAAAAGLPLEAATPHTVQGHSTGTAVGDDSSGSSMSGPVSSGSAGVAGALIVGLAELLGGGWPDPL